MSFIFGVNSIFKYPLENDKKSTPRELILIGEESHFVKVFKAERKPQLFTVNNCTYNQELIINKIKMNTNLFSSLLLVLFLGNALADGELICLLWIFFARSNIAIVICVPINKFCL